MGDRIKSLRREAGLSAAALARELGVTRSAVGQWESGATGPSMTHLSRIAALTGVAFEWLATGRGSPRGGAVRDARRDYPAEAVAKDPQERRLLARFRELPPKRRKALLDMLDD